MRFDSATGSEHTRAPPRECPAVLNAVPVAINMRSVVDEEYVHVMFGALGGRHVHRTRRDEDGGDEREQQKNPAQSCCDAMSHPPSHRNPSRTEHASNASMRDDPLQFISLFFRA